MEKDILFVGIGEIKIARAGDPWLGAAGLGSCVGVTVWDPVNKLGGLAHILLPSSPNCLAECANPARYADQGVQNLFDEIVARRASVDRLVWKIAGGANTFSSNGRSPNASLAVGVRNVEAVLQALRKMGMVVTAQDVGGCLGRSMFFNPSTGEVFVRQIGETLRRL